MTNEAAGQLASAWEGARLAIPLGWRLGELIYDPDRRLWSVWALPHPPVRVMPLRGAGPTEAAALIDLATKLRARG